jgi:hypothetical protein
MAAPPKPRVIIAVYGGVKDDKIQARIVTKTLQKAINDTTGEKVEIKHGRGKSMGEEDPFSLVKKQLGAIVEVKPGQVRAFVGEEGQKIDFTP